MNSKLLKILAIGAMAMACVACDDDDKDISCENVTCESGTCDRGVCVTDAMKAVQAGAACDDTFVEFCNGDSMVYCVANKVVIDDCANDGGCSIVKQKSEDGTKEVATAWCRGTDKCTDTTATEPYTAPYCVEEEYEGEKIALASAWYCVKNTEGSYTAIDMAITGIYDICDTTCNADKTACEKNFPHEGEACVPGEYKEKCTNGVVDFCYEGETEGTGEISAYKCDEGYTCTVFESENYADCVSAEADDCTEGETFVECVEDPFFGTTVDTYVCAKASNGKLYYILKDYISCDDGYGTCNEAGTACAE